MKHIRYLFLLLMGYISLFSSAQTIRGKIIDAITNEPIPSVNVYYSGTSKGTITDFDGEFEIAYYENSQSVLTVSLLGYVTQRFTDPLNTNFSNLHLQPKVGDLPAVYLNPDPWSREKKEKYFIKQFIGSTRIADKCKILNLDKIRMRFNPSTNTMMVYAQEPVLIENRDLNYLVTYDLRDFEIIFERIDLEEMTISGDFDVPTHRMVFSFFTGSAFFKELDENDAKKRWVRRNRKRAYKVSELRLFKLIAENRLEQEKYHLLFKRKKVSVNNHIRSKKRSGVFIVDFREKNYEIMDGDGFQSAIYLEVPKLIISETGNVLNYEVLKMGGYISKLKVSGMLPLEYQLKE